MVLIVLRGTPAGGGVRPVPVWAAFLVGGFIVTWPMYVARSNPGERANRRQIAIAQAFMACLVVHFSRGRSEIHLAAIASFVFVALYRDTRLLLLSTGIVLADHMLGNFFWSGGAVRPSRSARSWPGSVTSAGCRSRICC